MFALLCHQFLRVTSRTPSFKTTLLYVVIYIHCFYSFMLLSLEAYFLVLLALFIRLVKMIILHDSRQNYTRKVTKRKYSNAWKTWVPTELHTSTELSTQHRNDLRCSAATRTKWHLKHSRLKNIDTALYFRIMKWKVLMLVQLQWWKHPVRWEEWCVCKDLECGIMVCCK